MVGGYVYGARTDRCVLLDGGYNAYLHWVEMVKECIWYEILVCIRSANKQQLVDFGKHRLYIANRIILLTMYLASPLTYNMLGEGNVSILTTGVQLVSTSDLHLEKRCPPGPFIAMLPVLYSS